MTETSSSETARAFVSAWLLANHEQLDLRQLKFEQLELPAKTLSTWYQTEDLLVDITVWDHAHCLDILVMEQPSNELVFSEAGSCESTAGLLARLNALSGWLTGRAAGA
ncbi:MAG: hypothetical protein DI584_07975 [Stenotrophomonas sp.]|jgi:hypothetical protein|nr:MAG: hypothetical protein DI584_07975 [Stenotrophomonas sp.]